MIIIKVATLESRNADSENSQLQHVGNLTKSSEKVISSESVCLQSVSPSDASNLKRLWMIEASRM